jgi:hypothetical protein
VLWRGFPTYASTQTIFTILKANWYYLVQNKFVEWDAAPAQLARKREDDVKIWNRQELRFAVGEPSA